VKYTIGLGYGLNILMGMKCIKFSCFIIMREASELYKEHYSE
jgi:hypothetical protein